MRIPLDVSRKSITFFFSAILVSSASLASFHPNEKPVPDRKLERRLTRDATYRTQAGENLVSLAYLFYGHRTWWKKIKKDNPHLAAYGPFQKIQYGTRVKYRAVDVGDQYVVQPNDWLIRVALWKFGEWKQWEALFVQNQRRIQNPNLIRPGDRLVLHANGQIQNLSSGATLVEGAKRIIASEGRPTFFSMGFILGMFALLMMPLFWWLRQRQQLATSGAVRREFGMRTATGKAAAWKAEAEDFADEGDVPMKKDKIWRPRYLMGFDRCLIRREGTEADLRRGYHELSPTRRRNYLNRKVKKKQNNAKGQSK